MLRKLLDLFSGRDRLTALSRGPDRVAFVRHLLAADVVLLALPDGPGLDAATFTEDELLAEIKRSATDLDRGGEVVPFGYDRDGRQVIPFFSTQQSAQAFCGEYSKERNRVFAFQAVTVRGDVLATLLPGCDTLVLNARTPDEYALTEAELELLRAVR